MIKTSEDDIFSKKSASKASDKENNHFAAGGPNSASSAAKDVYNSDSAQIQELGGDVEQQAAFMLSLIHI